MLQQNIFQEYFPHYALSSERVSRFLYIQSLLALFSVFPFALLRLYQAQWLQAAVDFAIVAMILSMAALAKKSKNSSNTVTWIATASYVGGVWFTVANFESYTMLWAFPVVVALHFILSPRNAFFTNLVFLAGIWFFITPLPVLAEMMTFSVMFMLVNIFVLQFSTRLYQDNQALEDLSNQDPLTGTGNRRSLDKKLNELLEQKKSAMTLMMLDLDHFKEVNDSYGHQVGDKLLKDLVQFISSNQFQSFKIYRFGGEEFCLLVDDSLQIATDWAKTLCFEIENEFKSREVSITVSIGITTVDSKTDPVYWLRAADEALYAAKRSGRNQAKVYKNGRFY